MHDQDHKSNSTPNTNPAAPIPQLKGKGKMWRKVIISVAIASTTFLIGTGAYAGYLYYKANQTLDNISVPETTTTGPVTDSITPVAQEEPQIDRPISFLLSGVDNREGSGGTMNSDVLMLASYDPATKSASLLSIPRDLKVASDDHGTHKANYYFAYYYNKDKDTVIPNMKEFYGDLMQTPIDYMVVIDFEGLRDIVDALGGLDLYVDMDMRYTDSADGTNIDLKQGQQQLNGKQVLDFVRYRKSNHGTQESSDTARNERQQQVLGQLMEKMSSLSGITQWGKILDIVGDHIKTDIEKDKLVDWIIHYRSMKPQSVELMGFEGIWDSPYIYVSESELETKLEKVRGKLNLAPLDTDDLHDHLGTRKTEDDVASSQ
ncbi:LCP family protein required for cell wall assembly [Paenibacillus phyllosphaerae]|uniref:LCP family protein required for cell wall assembly n=1 Tax=Paenibacillus phyllosphaerae TaxID=274593 RepID=A0A7W5B411_9BACL|nr:LCP family protein [Paenibacillus phyllosphaerae]MBB3113551.1 LCP family protein required for cell wall assembly [Paenibacillus phyllosphaerae]